MRSVFRAFAIDILAVIAALATIVGFYFQWIAQSEWAASATVGTTFLGVFALYFFGAYIFAKTRWMRRARYVGALERLNAGFEEIHDLNRHAEEASKGEIKRGFRILCNNLSDALTYATASKCSVCVKVLESLNDENAGVRTLCRDEQSSRARRRADRATKEKEINHLVEENTAFRESIENHRGRFICNRLPWLRGYTNTSHQLYGNHPPEGPRGGLLARYWRWKLPYKSTIVVPITPPHGKDNTFEPDDLPNMVGFLCVDSPQMGVFIDEYDTKIMKGVADGLYNTLASLKGKLGNGNR